MSLFDLASLVTVSKEDFADAHEPLNDGVKKVPNAQTVAASTKTGDVGSDTTSAGQAKVIPEKKDNEDASKPEHTTVKESAERGGNDSKPAAPAPKGEPAKADKDSGSDTPAKPFTPKSEESDEGASKAPAKVDEEPLAHDTEKATKDDIDKTDKAKTSLEAFLPKAKTFDIIGYPKVQGERVSKMVDFLYRRAGRKAPATLSLESITTAVELGQHRLSKLERDMRRHHRNARGDMTFSIEGYTLPTHNQLLRISMEEVEKEEAEADAKSDSGSGSGSTLKRMVIKLMAIIRRLIKKGREMFNRAAQNIGAKVEKARQTLKEFINGKPREVYFSALMHTLFIQGDQINLAGGKKLLGDIKAKAKEVNTVMRNRIGGSLSEMASTIQNMAEKVEHLHGELHDNFGKLLEGKQGARVMMDRAKANELLKFLDEVEDLLEMSTYEAMDKPDFLNVEQALSSDSSSEDVNHVKSAQQELVEAVEEFTKAMYRYVARISVGIIDINMASKEKQEESSNEMFRVSAESFVEGMEQPVVEVPTETGCELLQPPVAEGLTQLETDPLDVPMLEIQRVQETVEVLTQGAAAVERYIGILRANPKMSKQAAAVLQAGLEHIDQVCGLKIRTTGMENYLTTPRAAMEEAAVEEKTLLDRAGEIGAKILKWLKDLAAKALQLWDNYKHGLMTIGDKAKERAAKAPATGEGQAELNPVKPEFFVEGDFVGDQLTPDELDLAKKLRQHYANLKQNNVKKALSLLARYDGNQVMENLEGFESSVKSEESVFAELPGEHWIVIKDGKLELGEGKPEVPDSYTVEGGDFQLKSLYNTIAKAAHDLAAIDTAEVIKSSCDEVSKALVAFRKGKGNGMDEADFQKVQQVVVDNTIKLFDVDGFFSILKYAGRLFGARMKLAEQMHKA